VGREEEGQWGAGKGGKGGEKKRRKRGSV